MFTSRNKSRMVRGVAIGLLAGSAALIAPQAANAASSSVPSAQRITAVSVSSNPTRLPGSVGPSATAPMTNAFGVQQTKAGAGPIIKWVLAKAPGAYRYLVEAAKSTYAVFKAAWERFVPWLVRKAAAVLWTIYEIYEAFRDLLP
jgi:lipoprotein-anchoring transpeptidase ErfK/SrfK